MASPVGVSEGVSKQILRSGDGTRLNRGDKIKVHCTGLLAETNTKFWSTKDPGQQPFEFTVGVGQVIAGWDEGCLTMSKGEVARLILAPHKGYGSQGFPAWGFMFKSNQSATFIVPLSLGTDAIGGASLVGISIKPNAPLIFEIEILTINGR